MLKYLLFLALSWALAEGFGKGAPTSVCSTLFPGHGVQAQTTTSPYRIQLSSCTARPGGRVNVAIKGSSGETFEGFMIQAMMLKVGTSKSEPIGNFTTADSNGKTLNCLGGSNNTVTHSSSKKKSDINLTWNVPRNLTSGSVVFKATVLRRFSVFWTNIMSESLLVMRCK